MAFFAALAVPVPPVLTGLAVPTVPGALFFFQIAAADFFQIAAAESAGQQDSFRLVALRFVIGRAGRR